ncbi:MAG TPA: serine/threonine-protein kinase, partial [Polyangiaceae bacterium]
MLGRGGMGVVQLVEDDVRGQRIAVKRLLRATGSDARRLKHEFRAIEQIRHPNIVSLYELGQDEFGLYLAMELVDGPNVRAWCRASVDPELGSRDLPGSEHSGTSLDISTELARTSWAGRSLTLDLADPTACEDRGYECPLRPLDAAGYGRLLAVVTQVISALRCLHERGLVHRDLKPSNVLVDRCGALKLLDFGILGETASVPIGALQGTVAYIAPEQARGEAPDPANDLYSLGVMLFEIVTGALPFVGSTRQAVLAQHLEAVAPDVRDLAPDCPEWVRAAIEGLLVKEPRYRLSLEDLAAVVAGSGSEAMPRPQQAPSGPRLVERQTEQRLLADVLDRIDTGEFRFVAIEGPTGVGKSALLEWQRTAARRRGHLCLQSRVRFTERVPFNAIDGLVDDLAAAVEHDANRFDDDDAHAGLATAAVAFPVLRHLSRAERPAAATIDQAHVFDALVSLIERRARGRERVILFCDDLQWADADSVALLQRLVVVRPRNVSLFGTVRDDMRSAPFERWWSRASPDLRLPLKKLTEEGLVHLITLVAEG